MREALENWLGLGVSLKVLKRSRGGYAIRSGAARKLADPRFAPFAAALESLTRFDYRLILEMPERAKAGRKFTLGEQPGVAVAEMSRMLAPVVMENIRDSIPKSGPFRVLDVGCGTAEYLRFACRLNPDLTALGVEAQPAVADAALKEIRHSRLDGRVNVQAVDVRRLTSYAEFDLALLNLVVHYTPSGSRIALFQHIHGLLKRGGRVLITNPVRTNDLRLGWLNLWGQMTEGCGPLPSVDELTANLMVAGFASVSRRRLTPGMGFYSFAARKPA
jgi:SAM-dependent methyltransferase